MKRTTQAAKPLLWRVFVALWLIAAPAAARPYGVEDILATEAIGDVKIAPGGRWLLFARKTPMSEVDRVDFATMDIRRSRLFRVDLAHPGAAEPLLDRADSSGCVMLGFSPRGSRLAVARLDGWHWRLGVVTLADGRVRWFDVAPSYFPGISTLAWISEDRLVTLAQPDGLAPWKLRQTKQDEDDVVRAWADFARGTHATVTAIGSGPLLDDRAPPLPERLVLLDVDSGAQTLLGSGDYESLLLSPDRRHLAVHILGVMNHPPTVPISETFDLRRRGLMIYDLATGRSRMPCPACDVSFASQSWSADGRRLLFFARGPGHSWEEGDPWIANLTDGHAQPLILDGIRPKVSHRLGEYDSVGLGWRGSTPLLFAQPSEGSNRADWFALGEYAPVVVSAGLASPAGQLLPGIEGLPVLRDGSNSWVLEASGPRRLFSGVDGVTALPSAGDALTGWTRAASGLRIRVRGSGGRSMQLLVRYGGDLTLEDVSLHAKSVILTATYPDGVEEVLLARPHRKVLVVARINRYLADVTTPRIVQIQHRLPDGRTVTSWLYRPPIGETPPPLIVIPYPGHVFASTAPALWNPGTGRTYTNVSALVGHGYAVLLPSMPTLAASDTQAFDFAGQILSAVDAVVAKGYADPHRLGLWGHSFGGYTAATVAAETDRFRAIVASNGIYDLTSFQGQFAAAEQRNPGEGQSILFWAGWTETAQPGMLGDASDFPARYLANSPLHHVDRIHTPMLIVGSDRDIRPSAQSEAMFSALYRRDKEAQLVTYWGEDHVNVSPANVRDLYARVFSWFDDHFAKANQSQIDGAP